MLLFLAPSEEVAARGFLLLARRDDGKRISWLLRRYGMCFIYLFRLFLLLPFIIFLLLFLILLWTIVFRLANIIIGNLDKIWLCGVLDYSIKLFQTYVQGLKWFRHILSGIDGHIWCVRCKLNLIHRLILIFYNDACFLSHFLLLLVNFISQLLNWLTTCQLDLLVLRVVERIDQTIDFKWALLNLSYLHRL